MQDKTCTRPTHPLLPITTSPPPTCSLPQMEDMKGKIRVYCRVRPVLKMELDRGQTGAGGGGVRRHGGSLAGRFGP